ncbi:MAG TPA: hypothetical protein VN660_09135 [Steroidobacteraceae bacterium]|nr:hypothetical protein [Steroidobacteraceae bacterium]
MKQTNYRLVVALGALGLALHAAPALSARPPAMVSGSVTAIQARSVVVNGVSYEVQLQGSALHQLGQLHVGDRVQLVLTGRKGAAQVSAIRVQNGR